MVTFSELLNAQPGKLKDSADAWDLWSKAVDDHAQRLDAVHTKMSTNWSGTASHDARTLVADAHLRASSSATALTRVTTVLNSAYTSFSQAHNDLLTAGNQAIATGFAVTQDGQVIDPNNLIGRATGDKKTQLTQTKTDLQKRIDKAVRDATTADGQVASTLRSLMPSGGTKLAGGGGGGGGGAPSFHSVGTPLRHHVNYGANGDMPWPANAESNARNPHAQTALAFAHSHLGDPYHFGATGPKEFDCSGLTLKAYQAAGVNLPRTAAEQWAAGPRIPNGQEQPGDLVFFTEGTSTVQHVGIVVDPVAGTMVAAPHTGSYVKMESYKTFPGGYLGFTRPGMP
jgi:cell wall-associated NlpC family hydrolase